MATRLALWEAVCRMSEAARSDEHDIGGRGERAAFSTARVGFRHVQESGRRPDSRSETDLVMAITGFHSQWRVPFSTSTSHIRPIPAPPVGEDKRQPRPCGRGLPAASGPPTMKEPAYSQGPSRYCVDPLRPQTKTQRFGWVVLLDGDLLRGGSLGKALVFVAGSGAGWCDDGDSLVGEHCG